MHAAITAAFTNVCVDEHPLIWIRELAPLPTAPFFGSAGLDIKDCSRPFDILQPLLYDLQLLARMKLYTRRKGPRFYIFLVIINDDQFLQPNGIQLCRNPNRVQSAVVVLATRHCNCIIVEQLVGHRRARCDSRSDCLNTRMVIGSVADVLEYMLAAREQRLAYPVCPFGPHMGKANGRAVHPLHHVMTTNPRIGPRALWHLGRAVMRAPGTEVRQTRGNFLGVVRPLGIAQLVKTGTHRISSAPFLAQDFAQLFSDLDRIKRPAGRKQLFPVSPLGPAIHPTTTPIVKDRLFDLHFDQLALFFDHHDQIEPFSPFVKALPVQRPNLPDLVGGNPQAFRLGLINAQQ